VKFRGIIAVLILVSSSVGLAQEAPPLAAVSPLWVGHLRPEGLELENVGVGGWTISVAFAYGNSFFVSPEIAETHAEVNGIGAVLTQDVLDQARSKWPQADLLSVDTEGSRFDVEVGYASGRWFAGMRVPIWRFGGTRLDGWPTGTHDLLGVSNNGREYFPEGRTTVVLMPNGGGMWSFEGSRSFQLMGVTGWGGVRWSFWDGGHQRFWFAFSAPVGSDGPWGERGWNGGPRWSISKGWGGLGLYGGLGWTHQGGAAGTLGDAADTFHGWGGIDASLGKDWAFLTMFRIDDSVFAEVCSGKAGRTTGEFAIGFAAPLGPRVRFQLILGEDFPGMGMPPDFSIQGRVVWRP